MKADDFIQELDKYIYRGVLEDGSDITVGFGGDAGDIYKIEVTADEEALVSDLYPHTGRVTKDGEEVINFYDY